MISKFDCFFYEWLIVYKKLDLKNFSQLTEEEFQVLQNEFIDFDNKLN